MILYDKNQVLDYIASLNPDKVTNFSIEKDTELFYITTNAMIDAKISFSYTSDENYYHFKKHEDAPLGYYPLVIGSQINFRPTALAIRGIMIGKINADGTPSLFPNGHEIYSINGTQFGKIYRSDVYDEGNVAFFETESKRKFYLLIKKGIIMNDGILQAKENEWENIP